MHKLTETTPFFHQPSRPQPEPPRVISDLLADVGLSINGNQPWDIQIYDEKVYRMILYKGSLGFGVAYMEGLWEAEQLDETFHRLLSADLDRKLKGWARVRLLTEAVRHRIFNLQSQERAFTVAHKHYDIGNDVFEAMLDSTMSYSCAYWEHADNLEQAQQHKLDMICRKLALKPGEHLLEIGCGWGGFAQYAAETIGARVTGVTISQAQHDYAVERMKRLGLDDRVEIVMMDYRDIKGQFDAVVSIEMFEAVGESYWGTYFTKLHDVLKKGGKAGLQIITIADEMFEDYRSRADFIQKYVFPGGMLPSAQKLLEQTQAAGLKAVSSFRFGGDYAETLKQWGQRFEDAWKEGRIKGFDAHFRKLWLFYLAYCEAGFRTQRTNVVHLELQRAD